MKLVYESGYEYESKLGDRVIKFKAWTAKNERDYLELLEKGPEDISDKLLFDTLIVPCIDDKKIVLSSAEQKKLIIDIRKESISDEIEDTRTCENCEEVTEIKFKIDSIMEFVPAKFKDVTVKDIKFSFGPLTNNKQKENLKLEDGVIKYIFEDFMLHIKSIELNGEDISDFKKKELNDFIHSLPSKMFDEVFEAYQEQIDKVNLDYEFTCPKCKHKEEIDYTFIPNFLWA